MEVTALSHAALVALSLAGGYAAFLLIPAVRALFLKARLQGKDLNKADLPIIPESMGVIVGMVYLVVIFLFIPFHFHKSLLGKTPSPNHFPYDKFVEFVSALLSICCMIFLGFADDVLNLAWRHKLLLPTVASLPLLVVYFVNDGSTWVLVPPFVQEAVGGESINLGIFFYVYMSMLAVFCTNAINIMAGINGVETGQSFIIAASLLVLSLVEYLTSPVEDTDHYITICLLLPFCAVCAVLFYFNKYPASVFVGDTFCYFAGMTFAVTGILGHLSRILLLFLAPQVFNFVLSVPQLFKFVPCPRHRMPKFNPKTGLLQCSIAPVENGNLRPLGRVSINILSFLRLVSVDRNEDGAILSVTNFTILNVILNIAGPMSEKRLANIVFALQVLCSCAAFLVNSMI